MAKRNPAIIKRDSKENWKKSKYVPEENVIIIMDNPNVHSQTRRSLGLRSKIVQKGIIYLSCHIYK